MQQVIRYYMPINGMPINGDGHGNPENPGPVNGTTGSNPVNDESNIPTGDGGRASINNVSELDRLSDLGSELFETDNGDTNSPDVGAGGDLANPGIGTLDDFLKRESGSMNEPDTER